MWAGKWTLATLVTDKNVIENAFNSILVRTGSVYNSDYISMVEVFKKQLLAIDPIVIISLILSIIFWFYTLFKKYEKNKIEKNIAMFLYLIIMLMPIIWYAMLKNHSYIHGFFTFRNITICLLSILLIFINFFKTKKTKYM